MRPTHSTWTTSATTTASTTFPCATPANGPLSFNPLRYAMYLHLKSKHPDTFLVPCYDFDLVWHAHQLDPVTYAADTKAVLGKLMPHDDSVNDRSEGERTPPSVALGTPAHHSCTRTATPSTPTSPHRPYNPPTRLETQQRRGDHAPVVECRLPGSGLRPARLYVPRPAAAATAVGRGARRPRFAHLR